MLFSKGFYSLGAEIARPQELRFFTLFLFFLYWIFIQNLLIPLFLYGITPFISKYATLQGTRLWLITLSQWSYALLILLGFILLHFHLSKDLRQKILLRYGYKNTYRDTKGKEWIYTRIFYDIGFALLILLIALPTVSFLDGFSEYILTKIVELPIPNQVAVQYLIDSKDHLFAYSTMIIVAIVFAPFIEEYLFRGLLQTYIRGYFGPKGSILLSSLIFSLFHFSLSQSIGNIPLLISLFIFALYLGFCYEKRESLVASIALHMSFNATSVIRMHFFEG